MERNGISETTQGLLKNAFKILFREGLTISNALARIEASIDVNEKEVQHLVQFIRQTKRGIGK
jgi:UDP-N-acetylglucosamine acyltransferase